MQTADSTKAAAAPTVPAVLAAKPGESFGGTHVQSTTATAAIEAVLPAAEELRRAMPL